MKRSALALAMLSLAACDPMPLAPGEEVAGLQSAATLPPGFGPLIPLTYEALINFDTDPTGAAIPSGTSVAGTYASMGVTFSCLNCGYGSGLPLALATSATNNGVAPAGGFSMFDERVGVIVAEFASPRRYVAIDATRVLSAEDLTGFSPARPWLQAYDANGALVYTAYWVQGGAQTQMLMVGNSSSAALIKSVRFSSEFRSPPAYGIFDNLRFDTAQRPRPRF
jgi:hypothetical protein